MGVRGLVCGIQSTWDLVIITLLCGFVLGAQG